MRLSEILANYPEMYWIGGAILAVIVVIFVLIEWWCRNGDNGPP